MWDKHNNILNLWNKAIGVGQTQHILNQIKQLVWDKHNILNREIKQLVWDKHNNILSLWNKAIGVGQTQQHLKSVK